MEGRLQAEAVDSEDGDVMAKRRWEIIGAPFDSGSSHKGSKDGPASIRTAGLIRRIEYLKSLGFEVEDGGDVEAPEPSDSDKIPRGLDEMTAYAPLLMKRLEVCLRRGNVPLVLGGDHSISIPTVSAVADFLRSSANPRGPLGLVWVDAHPDLETPGEDSTNDLHAMATAHLLDLGVPGLRTLGGFAPKVQPEHLVYIGLRDVVSEEKQHIRDMGITSYTASDVERMGIASICDETFAHMAEKTDAFVLSFDVDAVDPMAAPGVDYPEPGGLTIREATVVMESAGMSPNLAMVELVETNPKKDRDDMTSRVAIGLIHRLICGPLI
jgi:arginase